MTTLLHYFRPDAPRYKLEISSLLKAHALKDNFILPASFSGRYFDDDLAYYEEMPRKSPVFVSFDEDESSWKYTPCSNFSIWNRALALPLIIEEVIESGRHIVLLQGIALARLAFYFNLRRHGSNAASPFVVTIYLTKELVVERYIIMQTESADDDMPQVYISQKNFNLIHNMGATAFQREMFDLASEFKSVFEQLDGRKRRQLWWTP